MVGHCYIDVWVCGNLKRKADLKRQTFILFYFIFLKSCQILLLVWQVILIGSRGLLSKTRPEKQHICFQWLFNITGSDVKPGFHIVFVGLCRPLRVAQFWEKTVKDQVETELKDRQRPSATHKDPQRPSRRGSLR